MQVARAALLSLSLAVGTAPAADKPFTVALTGWGRACAGALFVRTKTIEWNTPFVTCKPSSYEVVDSASKSDRKSIAFRLLKPNRACVYRVIQVVDLLDGNWDVVGYQSLEAYEKRDLPEWRISPLPERNRLSCPMEARDGAALRR